MHSPGHVAATDELARRSCGRTTQAMIDAHRPGTRLAADHARSSSSAKPALMARLRRVAGDGRGEDRADGEGLGLARFDLKYSAGTLPHDADVRSIELFGTEVAPRVRELLVR